MITEEQVAGFQVMLAGLVSRMLAGVPTAENIPAFTAWLAGSGWTAAEVELALLGEVLAARAAVAMAQAAITGLEGELHEALPGGYARSARGDRPGYL